MHINEALAIKKKACDDKVVYYTVKEANAAVRRVATRVDHAAKVIDGQHGINKYRCPFAGGEVHWHVGHTMSLEHMQKLADAIRVLAGHDLRDRPQIVTSTIA